MTKIKTAIILLLLSSLPGIIFIVLYLWVYDNSISNFLKSTVSFFNLFYEREQNNIALIGIILLLFMAQVLCGYGFNRINKKFKSEDKQGMKSKNSINEFFQNTIEYIANRILVLSYAAYEFLTFYILFLLIFGQILENYHFNGDELSSKFLSIIITTMTIILVGGVLVKLIFDFCFKKNTLFKSLKIPRTTKTGNLVHDLQMQLFNVLYVISLPLTLITIFGSDVDDTERTLFFGLITLVMSAYCFTILKSRLYDFFFKPII